MKERIPWPAKFAVKVVLGVLRVDYRVLKRAHLVEHGRMEQAEFSRSVFERHVAAPLREHHAPIMGTLLELGPGDSLATGFLGLAAGFDRVTLVDAGPFADLRPEAVRRVAASLGMAVELGDAASTDEVAADLCRRGIRYLTDGLRSVRRVEADSVAHSFSNSVLQHVHRDELPALIDELGRVHRRGSFTSHSVNFSDHFSGGFVNHRLPDWLMESATIKRANLYTNREGAERIVALFDAAGFALAAASVEFADAGRPDRARMRTGDELARAIRGRRVLRATFLLRKL